MRISSHYLPKAVRQCEAFFTFPFRARKKFEVGQAPSSVAYHQFTTVEVSLDGPLRQPKRIAEERYFSSISFYPLKSSPILTG